MLKAVSITVLGPRKRVKIDIGSIKSDQRKDLILPTFTLGCEVPKPVVNITFRCNSNPFAERICFKG